VSGCGQSGRLDRTSMTSSPQSVLTVDLERASHPLPALAASVGHEQQQQQQQLGKEGDRNGVSGCVKLYDNDAGVDLPAAAGGNDENDADEDNDDNVKTCPRCDREFRCQTRYKKHCRKCCND